MIWNTNTEPQAEGWYLCTLQGKHKRYVMPLYRYEYPEGNFYWDCLSERDKVRACVEFPEPYLGE